MGPGPVEAHLHHSAALSAQIQASPGRALDLGTGAGVPGVLLALMWPDARWYLLDGSVTRTRWLSAAIAEHLPEVTNIEVVAVRAEEAGRSKLRGTMDVVVARGFGPPAVTAECGAPFLKVGGRLIVSEPPAGAASRDRWAQISNRSRWDATALALLGLEQGHFAAGPPAIQSLLQGQPCPDRYPRRTGVPAKRPLF